MVKVLKKVACFACVIKQIITTFIQSMQYLKKGKLRKAFHWFSVRNYVSIFGNCARYTSKKSSDLTSQLRDEGFMELNKLSKKSVKRLVDYFLSSQPEKHNNLKDFFEKQRVENYVRSEAVDICSNNELCRSVLEELDILPVVSEFLGLSEKEISMSAKIDALFRINGKRNLRHGYDDALEFHRDVDSYRFVKAFSYLVDVKKGFGEHEICIRSHNILPLKLRTIERKKYSTLKENLPHFELKSILGKVGYSWIEDTTTFHRGTVPDLGDRLMLSLSFNDIKSTTSLYDTGYYPLAQYKS